MKILIPTIGKTITSRTFEIVRGLGYDLCLLVHNSFQAQWLAANFRYYNVPNDKTYITGEPSLPISGRAHSLDWAERNIIEPGEWYCVMNDTMDDFSGLAETKWYDRERINFKDHLLVDWRGEYETPISLPRMRQIGEEMIAKAEEVGTALAGFTLYKNYLMRHYKWTRLALMCGAFIYAKNLGFGWKPPGLQIADDYYRSLISLRECGSIIRNNYVRIDKKHFVDGGLGSEEKRYPHLVNDMKLFDDMFPGMLVTTPKYPERERRLFTTNLKRFQRFLETGE